MTFFTNDTLEISIKSFYGIFSAFFFSMFSFVLFIYFNFYSKIEEQNKTINQLVSDNKTQQLEIKRLLEYIDLLKMQKISVPVDSGSNILQAVPNSLDFNLSTFNVVLGAALFVGVVGLVYYGPTGLFNNLTGLGLTFKNALFKIGLNTGIISYDNSRFIYKITDRVATKTMNIKLVVSKNNDCLVYYQIGNSEYLPIEEFFVKYNEILTQLPSSGALG